MPNNLADNFDDLMTATCDLYQVTDPDDLDDYGQPLPAAYTRTLAGIACRRYTKGPGREYKQDKQSTVRQEKVAMRAQTIEITSSDRLVMNGETLNILDVLKLRDQASAVHHLELIVEVIKP